MKLTAHEESILTSKAAARGTLAVVVMFALIAPAVVCSADDSRTDDTIVDWTIMVYVDGDNDLESNVLEDFAEMAAVGSTGRVKVVALADTMTLTEGTHWYFIEKDEIHIDVEAGVHICDCLEFTGGCPEELNMGDGETLEYFTKTAVANAPADNYMLELWNHGASWYGICEDWSSELPDGSYDSLTMDEISGAIDAAYGDGVLPEGALKIIDFDACLMAGVEVAYEIRNLAEYMVAAITTIARQGFQWEWLLEDINALEDLTPRKIGETMVDSFMEFYSQCTGKGIGGYPYASLSLIDLSEVERLATEGVDDMASVLLDYVEDSLQKSAIQTTEQHTPQIQYLGELDPFVDLGLFALALVDRIPEMGPVAERIEDMVESAVVYYDFITSDSGACMNTMGISIYYTCAWGQLYDYGELAFGKDTQWDEFLFALSEQPRGP
ncbi:MAG: hypothetical protein JSV94_04815 [Methanobacteriota archaeon]|nr:MAG: hypothetical protein JSV94_04815 [Euryarchaeota archaeon]